MKRSLFLMMIALFIHSGCRDTKFEQLKGKAESLCRELVPDERTGICRVSVEKVQGGKAIVSGELLSPGYREPLVRLVREAGFEVIDSLRVLPDTTLKGKIWGIISVSVANLRSKPAHSAELVSQAVMGTPVRILKKKRDWLFVQTPDHYLSWTNSSSLVEHTEQEMELWKRSDRVMFTGQYGVIYGDDSQRISDLVAGCIVKGKPGKGKYLQLELPDGRKGIAEATLFRDFTIWREAAPALPENLVQAAREFIGIPYMWGGTSSKALDCSGFTKTVWFLNGIVLERDASQQYKYGEVTDAGLEQQNLRPGDLLFFGKKDPLRIIHVGIYAGNREVIHASGKVWVNSLDSTCANFSRYLFSTFVGAKRVLGITSQPGYLAVKDHPWY